VQAAYPQTGRVSYEILVTSRPHAPMARLGAPIARRLRRFRPESAAALARAIER